MTYYVSRDGTGAVSGLFAAKQPGLAEELLDEAAPDVQTFLGATLTGVQRAASAAMFSDPASPVSRVERAAALVVLDRVNELREWLTAFKAATAAATSLANLQTRVAALPNTPDYTAAQIKTAVQNKIASTDSD